MTCGGCSAAVQRVLGKLEGTGKIRLADADVPLCQTIAFNAGVTNVDTDLETKKVVVTGTVTQEECLAALKPWSEAADKSIAAWE